MFRKSIIVMFLLYEGLAAGCSHIDWEQRIVALVQSYRPKHFDFADFRFINAAPAEFSSITTLKWKAPSTNADGTKLKDLAGYKLFYGQDRCCLPKPIDTEDVTSIIIYNLEPGTWCFAVKAYNIYGKTSDFSNEKCKHIDEER